MRFIKKECLVRAVRVPDSDLTALHNVVLALFKAKGFSNFKFTKDKGYELLLPDVKLMASPGDWIVLDNNNSFDVYSHESFLASFEGV